ncbi:hypothetical protein EVAR_990_1 [Eumeta japonica]|uniref:Uncharacterized protein n=1 Tax=Eumeta variegata TaxID=151549 RepID=A0A4C1SGF5_EUMVA|nr:hypothetical protein EVAR_990_1 [Eumeta japonica]
MTVNPLIPPLDLWLTRESPRIGPPKRGHHHWICRGRILDEKTPGHEATNKCCVPHLRPRKGRRRPMNERGAGGRRSPDVGQLLSISVPGPCSVSIITRNTC